MKKRSLLSRLRTNGASYLIGTLLLLVGVPLYQLLVLAPAGYSNALSVTGNGLFTVYLAWIGTHGAQFILYRALLILAFALLLTLPFTLFRIIIAQELLGMEELAKEEQEDAAGEGEVDAPGETTGMPSDAWRGKGISVIAAWAGFFGLIIYIVGTAASTLYLTIISMAPSIPNNASVLASLFSIVPNTVGIGLLALSTLFFGGVIARTGRNLWPGIWVAFGYLALAVAILFSGSAVAVASSPATGQAVLTTPAILLFALWGLWFGIMLVRLKPD